MDYNLFQQGEHSLLALHVEDYDFAMTVLNSAGFKLVCQEELSR